MRSLNHFHLQNSLYVWLLLALIVIVALALRFNGINWDSGYGFHPDERSLYMRAGCMYDLLTERPGYLDCLREHPQIEPGLPGIRTLLDFDRSPLNPHWFPLGSVLIYILVFFRSIIELFTDIGALDMRYVGRSLSALADVGTVILVFLLGRRIYDRQYGPWVGLLAAALVAFAVIHVQHSHFYRPETFTALLVLAVFWAIFQVMEKRRLRDSLALGLVAGLAFAPKASILPVMLPLICCYYYRLVDTGNGNLSGVRRGAVEQTFLHALAASGVALAVFFLVTPYAFLYLSNFLAEQAAQANMARNAGLWPFTIQYVGTEPFLYQFKQTAIWGLGPLLGILAWAAVLFTAVLVWKENFARRADILMLAWVIPSILFLETFEVRFQRYYFALIPFMVLLGSRMLLWAPFSIRDVFGRRGGRPGLETVGQGVAAGVSQASSWWLYLRYDSTGQRILLAGCWVLVGAVLATTVLYSLAFQSVYSNPHPAVDASSWINERVPAGSSIVSDNHWDEFIPEVYGYKVWQFPAYEPDGVAKMAELGDRLSNSDYLVFYSQRPYVSVASDPERFPLSAEYYRQLFGGELGYRLEKKFSSYPTFLGISIADDAFGRTGLPRPESSSEGDSSSMQLNWGYADDNVVGYDHPTVLLFRNVEQLPPETVVAQLAGRPPKGPTGLKFSEEDWVRQQSGGTWSALFDRDSLANRWPTLAWLVAIELIYLVSLPLCLYIFRPLADRGIVLARILGLLVVSYLAWIVVSLGWFEFSSSAIWLSILALAVLSGLVLVGRWGEIAEFLRERWRLLLTGEAIFLAAFFAFVLIRAFNPDLWHPFRGGEKPMEMAYFNAVIRSSILPPYDPWFAGGYLNYYYWGYFILAIPTRLAGIVPTVAFNLAVPLLFALTVTGAYSVVYNLAEGVRRSRRPARSRMANVVDVEADMEYSGDYRTHSLQEITKFARVVRSPITAGLTAGLFVAVIGNLDGAVQLVQRLWDKVAGSGGSLLPFDFWRSSRMLPNSESLEPGLLTFWLWGKADAHTEVSWHITEFPFFSFLFADLHAHMIAIPFTILVIGLGLNLAVGLKRLGRVWDTVALILMGAATGSLWLINSWDYPSYLLLALVLVSVSVYLLWETIKPRIGWSLILVTAIIIASVVPFLPFHLAVETFGTGVEATRWKTPLLNFLGIHGLFLVIIVCFLVWQARRPLYIVAGQSFGLRYLDMGVETNAYRRSFQKWLRIYTGLMLLAGVFIVLAGYFTIGILAVILLLAGLVLWDVMTANERGQAYGNFPVVLVVMGLGLAIGVDLVRIEDDIGRMNTLFKYYLEVWVLFALAAAYFLWRMWYDNSFRPLGFRGVHAFWMGIVATLVLASLIYTFLGTQARLTDRFNPLPPNLDGTVYMEKAVHWEKEQPIELKWDLEAISWLQDNVEGSPVVLEAHTEQYRWGGRVSNYTGMPTVLGWPWHQIQQRGAYSWEVHERAKDVSVIYTTSNLARAQELLSKYDVAFVVVGDLERVFYPGEGPGKFDIMAQQGFVARVFDNGHTAIYQLRRPLAGNR